jgi:hypothetical protein
MSAAVHDRTIDWPVWWFVRLEAAVEQGDHAAAADAQRELERLGVSVRYGRPRCEHHNRQPAATGEVGDAEA